MKPAQLSTGSRGYLTNPGSPASPRSQSVNTDPREFVTARRNAHAEQRPAGVSG